MRKPRASWLIGVVIGAWALVSCTVPPVQVTAGSTTAPPQATSTPTITPTQEPTPEESATTSLPTVTLPDDEESDDISSPTPSEEASEDESTADDGSDETSDEATKPGTPDVELELSGPIIYTHRNLNTDTGKCGPIRDLVVDTSGSEDNHGVLAVQYHDGSKKGINMRPKYVQIDDILDVVVPPNAFEVEVLRSGDEPFPVGSDMTRCDKGSIPDWLYDDDAWMVRDLPYNGQTMSSPEALEDYETE